MKKLIAFACCVFAFRNYSQVAVGADRLEYLSGRRLLVRAIAVMVNSEAACKVPPKRIHLPNLESPRVQSDIETVRRWEGLTAQPDSKTFIIG